MEVKASVTDARMNSKSGQKRTLLERYFSNEPRNHFLARAKTLPEFGQPRRASIDKVKVPILPTEASENLEDKQSFPVPVKSSSNLDDLGSNSDTRSCPSTPLKGWEGKCTVHKRWSVHSVTSCATDGTWLAYEKSQSIINKNWFSVAIICVVILHSLFLAIDTDVDLGSGPTSAAFVVDALFTTVYIIEMILRLTAEKLHYFNNRWNLFDVLLIALSVADLVVVATTLSSDPSLSVMVTFRMLRLLRLVRMVRLFRFCKELWILTCGIISSMKTVFWAWLLIGMIIYIFSLCFARIFAPYTCLAREDGVSEDDNNGAFELDKYFGTVPRAMFSVFQCVTLEDWPTVAETASRHEPWVGPLFILLLMTSTYGVMHVIVAVFVNSALEASMVRSKDLAKKAKEEQVEACKKLCEVFKQADTDGNGVLSKTEFDNVLEQPGVIDRLNSVGIDVSSAAALFDILDLDGSQSLSGLEFVEGVLRSRGPAQNKDLIGVRCDIWRVNIKMNKDIDRAIAFIQDRVQHSLNRVEALRMEATPLLQTAMERLPSSPPGRSILKYY